MPRRPFVPALALAAASALAQPGAAPAPPIVPWEVPEEPGLVVETLAKGLEHPWALAFLPDGRLLVTERPGRLRLVERNGRVGPPLAGVPAVAAIGQGGLMDVALAPDFPATGTLFLTLAVGTEEANRTAVVRARLTPEGLRDVREIWRNPTPKRGGWHFGARLLPLPDGTLLVSVGDGGNPNVRLAGRPIRERAQDPKAFFGKTIRLTPDGGPAPGNPGLARPELGWDPHLFTIGHRNVQGLARDPATGALWATEHGAQGGDELNRLVAGANYGWPVVTFSREYSGAAISGETHRPGMVGPVSVWTPSIAPSGLAVYRGRALPALDGALFAGGLMSSDLRILRFGPDGRPRRETRLPIDERVRDVRVGPDGLVYVLTDEAEGRILRVRPRPR